MSLYLAGHHTLGIDCVYALAPHHQSLCELSGSAGIIAAGVK